MELDVHALVGLEITKIISGTVVNWPFIATFTLGVRTPLPLCQVTPLIVKTNIEVEIYGKSGCS